MTDLDKTLDSIYQDDKSRSEVEQAVLDWHNKQIEGVVDDIRSLELDDYDDTDPYQQGYMWAIGKAKTVAIEAERNKLKEIK